jgi:hypothetical protein
MVEMVDMICYRLAEDYPSELNLSRTRYALGSSEASANIFSRK